MINTIRNNYIYILLFFIANFFLLINYEGLYWDDWVVYNQEPGTLALFYGMIQNGIKGDFFNIISKFFNHIYLFRVFVFLAYALIGFFTYKILISMKLFNKFESKLIAFVSIIVPIHASMTLISIAPFLFPVLLFYFAFFLLTKYYQSNDTCLKIIILYLFFLSFSTNSLLVFYGIVIVYLFYMDNNKSIKFSYASLKKYLFMRIDFIVLPIVYFIYKKTFLATYGLYASYNQINTGKLLNSGNILMKTFETMTTGMFSYLTSNMYMVAISLIVAALVTIKTDIKSTIFKNRIILLFILSTVLFLLAVFPYAAVSKTPVIDGSNGRFSLLLGISMSFFLMATIASISWAFLGYRNKVFIFMISSVVILMISKNITEQYNQNIDWFYQVSIMENFKENEIIKNHTTFIVHNNIRSKLHGKRDFRFYGLNGLLKKVFGDTKRLMILPPRKKQLPDMYRNFGVYKQYNFYAWNNNQNPIDITINFNIMPSVSMQAKLFLYYVFSYDKFLQLAKSLTVVAIRK